jgi:uncharacterized protein with predicted RNA binding PUA domain
LIVRRPLHYELARLKLIADYQFGEGAGECLLGVEEVLVGVSPATRRIREVYIPGQGLYLVLRANDYLFTLSLTAAQRLKQCFPPPRLRVVVDSAKLAKKSVPCNAVVDVDSSLRPGDEVIVVDQNDGLVGVGRLRLPVDIIRAPNCRGEAVRLRKRVER